MTEYYAIFVRKRPENDTIDPWGMPYVHVDGRRLIWRDKEACTKFMHDVRLVDGGGPEPYEKFHSVVRTNRWEEDYETDVSDGSPASMRKFYDQFNEGKEDTIGQVIRAALKKKLQTPEEKERARLAAHFPAWGREPHPLFKMRFRGPLEELEAIFLKGEAKQ